MFFDPNQCFNSSMQIVFELSSRYKHVTRNLNSACLLCAYSKRTIQSVPQALPNNTFHVSSNAHECKQTPLTYSPVRSRPILDVSVRRLLKVRGMKLLRYFFHSLALQPWGATINDIHNYVCQNNVDFSCMVFSQIVELQNLRNFPYPICILQICPLLIKNLIKWILDIRNL